jgi:hypothetical protein
VSRAKIDSQQLPEAIRAAHELGRTKRRVVFKVERRPRVADVLLINFFEALADISNE